EVEQDQEGISLLGKPAAVGAEQVSHRIGAVAERNDLVVDAGATDVALDQPGVPLVVLDHDDGNRLRHRSTFRLLAFQATGSVIVNVLPVFSSDDTDMVPPRR